MERDLHPISKVVIGATSLGAAILLAWWTITAFVGGTMPVIGWETDGGVGTGLLWLFVVDPIAMTVLMWASMVVSLPIVALLDRDKF